MFTFRRFGVEMRFLVGALTLVIGVQSYFMWQLFKSNNLQVVQGRAIDQIKMELVLEDKPCYVNWEEGYAYAKLDLKTQKMVRCDVDQKSRTNKGIIQFFKNIRHSVL